MNILKFLRCNKGQALVEFALVLPILAVLLFGIMEMGRVFAGYIEVQHMVREGARFSAIKPGDTDTDVRNYMRARLVILDSAKFDASPPLITRNNEWVEVDYTYPMQITTPLISDLVGSTVNLKAKIVMRNEGGRP